MATGYAYVCYADVCVISSALYEKLVGRNSTSFKGCLSDNLMTYRVFPEGIPSTSITKY